MLRDVMVRNGDGAKRLWATAFGWNALPEDWTGRSSPWGQVDKATQAATQVRRLRWQRCAGRGWDRCSGLQSVPSLRRMIPGAASLSVRRRGALHRLRKDWPPQPIGQPCCHRRPRGGSPGGSLRSRLARHARRRRSRRRWRCAHLRLHRNRDRAARPGWALLGILSGKCRRSARQRVAPR